MTSEVITLEIVDQHEKTHKPHISIHHYTVADHCPVAGGQLYAIELKASDLERIFLCRSEGFLNFTINDSFKLGEILENHPTRMNITEMREIPIDLRQSIELAPLFLSNDLEFGNLAAIDGNHRLIAHYLTHRDIEGLKAYLFVHANAAACDWYS